MAAQIGAPTAAIRAHEELFAYWNSLRRCGAGVPARADVHPGGFKRLLPNISLTEVIRPAGGDAPIDYRIRLAGTGLYHVYAREITGRRLIDVYNSAAADYWKSELGKLLDDRKPAVGLHNLAWRGASHLSIIWLRLPLSRNGEEVDMILGYDAVVGYSAMPSSGIRAA